MKSLNLFLLIIVILSSCRPDRQTGVESENSSFADQNLYSDLFSISHQTNYSKLSLRSPWQGSGSLEMEYYITTVPDSLPDEAADATVIVNPVKRIVCLSTTHVAMIERLGEEEGIVAVSGTKYVSSSKLRSRIDEGLVKEIGFDSNLNIELIVSLAPDLVVAYGVGAESAGYMSKLEEAGIPLLFISDYLETDPLARAEWIKVFGLLYGREIEAATIFQQIAGEYEVLKNQISSRITDRPVVMAGLPFKDTWFVSPGNSYISSLIYDAGGEYLWGATLSDISMPMSLESVYVKAMSADIWINSGAALSLDDILSIDSRLGDLPPVKNRKVFNNMKRYNANGGNPYWEAGVIDPQTILKDLVYIIHPELFMGWEPCYYIRLEEK